MQAIKRCLRMVSIFAAGITFLTAGAALAHHGDAGRYEDALTTISGTVVELQLVNPHSILIVEAKDAKGKAVRWRGELGSPAILKGWCWTNTILKAGDKVTIIGR